jgi:hypothetical protein
MVEAVSEDMNADTNARKTANCAESPLEFESCPGNNRGATA